MGLKEQFITSTVIQGAESRYLPIEWHCLALVFAAQKLHHYLISYTLHLVTKCYPIKYLLTRPTLAGRPARWLFSLAEYEMICKAPRAVKSQALADLLAHFPSGEYEPPSEELPGDEWRSFPKRRWESGAWVSMARLQPRAEVQG